MDFGNFDTRAAAEIARAIPIRAQATGEPILDGDKPCEVIIRGAASRSAQASAKAQATARAAFAKQNRAKGDDAKVAGDLHTQLVQAAIPLIVGFHNVQRKGDDGKLRDLTGDEEDVKWFLDLNFISMDHLMRLSALTIGEEETAAEFEARQARHLEIWRKPSFAQQILDAAQEDADFLPKQSRA